MVTSRCVTEGWLEREESGLRGVWLRKRSTAEVEEDEQMA